MDNIKVKGMTDCLQRSRSSVKNRTVNYQESIHLDLIFTTYWLWNQYFNFLLSCSYIEIDLIPEFGTSNKDISKWWDSIKSGTVCFFAPYEASSSRCELAPVLGFAFTFADCFSYVYGDLVFQQLTETIPKHIRILLVVYSLINLFHHRT